MGEISIDPKFNIHETYKKVRILNPYRNGAAPSSVVLEPETTAYMNALGIPDDSSTSIYGINNSTLWSLVNDFIGILKANSLYSLMYKIYPKIGSTEAQQAVDIITLSSGTFVGNWGFNASGAIADGYSYFNSNVFPSTLSPTSNDFGFTGVANQNVLSNKSQYGTLIGIYTGYRRSQFYINWNITADRVGIYFNESLSPGVITASNIGVFTVTKNNDLAVGYRNGNQLTSASASTRTFPSGSYYEAASNWVENGYASNYIEGLIGTTAYHKHLDSANVNILFNAIDALEIGLGRKQYV